MARVAQESETTEQLWGPETQKAVENPETKARLIAAGLEPGDLTPEQFAQFLKVQSERFGAVIKSANIKVE